MEGDHLNYWVREKEFTISTMSNQNFLQIRPMISESSLSYDKRKTSISEVVLDLGGEWKKQSLHITSFSLYMRTFVGTKEESLPSFCNGLGTIYIVSL